MLVLSRGEHDSIDIGPNIRVIVVAIRGNKVQLGIEAPAEVPIYRTEISPRLGLDTPPEPTQN